MMADLARSALVTIEQLIEELRGGAIAVIRRRMTADLFGPVLGPVIAVIWLVHWLVRRLLARRAAARAGWDIPDARGGSWLLGHALMYKADAPAFLCEQCARLGPIFRINLAGKRMVVVCGGRQAIMQATKSAESVLSARAAVQAIGFREALGELNVVVGTDFHKRVLKGWLPPLALAAEVAPLHACLSAMFELEIGRALGAEPSAVLPDVLTLVRRCVLRAMICRMLGDALLTHAGERLLDEVMAFQDALEGAIASASVLPRALALPLALWPVQRQRARLCKAIERALGSARAADKYGPWLRAFEAEGMPLPARAELVVGLLFAAHKNPAIGAAQAFLLALEHGGPELRAMRAEAARVCAQPSAAVLAGCGALRRCALETLRVTAHPIGAVRTVVAPAGLWLTADSGRRHHVQPGETIALSHIAPNLSTAQWGGDACSYNPSRAEWVAASAEGGEKSFASKGAVDEYTLTTFSQGLHKCPGEKLSLVVMQSAVAALLAGTPFRVEPLLPLPPVSFERATLAQRAAPVRFRASRRQLQSC